MTIIAAPKRIVGYARVSTERQTGEHHASLETQEAHILEFISRSNGIHVETFVDVLSGRRDDRPEYNRMVQFALDGGTDGIVVQFLDRLGRNPREILRRIWQLQDHGVSVEVTDEDIKEEMLLLIRAGMAGAESKRTSERVKSNMVRIVSKGTHSGRIPFGFKPVHRIEGAKAVVDHWEIEPTQAEVIREMYRLAVEENNGFLNIANELNDKGHRTSAGGHWVAASVQVILRNPALNGTLVYGRKTRKGNPEHDAAVVVKDVFPKILSDEEWAALQQRLDIRREFSRGSTHKSEYLLSGILRCGHCGGPMMGKAGALRNGRRYRNYYCSHARASKASCGFSNGHSAPKLEAAVLAYLGQYSDRKKVRELLAADGTRELKRKDSELRKITKRLNDMDSDFDKNLDLLKREVLNEAEFKKTNEARRGERDRLAAQQIEVTEWLRQRNDSQESLTALPSRIRSFMKDVQEANVRHGKALLQGILKSATVYNDGRIELEFRTSA